MKLFLIRHGQSITNETGTFAGHLDVPLSDRGRVQASRIPTFFQDIPVDAIYSSDLSRAMETVRPLAEAKGLTVTPDRGLRETYAGDWEGMLFVDLPLRYPEEHRIWTEDIGAARCTGGESMAETAARVDAALRRIAEAHPDDTVVVASHGAALRATLTLWETGSVAAMQQHGWMSNAGIAEIDYRDGTFTALRENMTEHLGDCVTAMPKGV